eukprot:10868268-Alexandrium_andersonii.AAC.1
MHRRVEGASEVSAPRSHASDMTARHADRRLEGAASNEASAHHAPVRNGLWRVPGGLHRG